MIPRFIKWGTIAGIAALIALFGYGAYLYGQIRDYAVRDEAHAADAIVILGAAQYNGRPSPVLKARLDMPTIYTAAAWLRRSSQPAVMGRIQTFRRRR